MLAHYLRKNLPDFHMTVVIKSASEWGTFVQSIHNKNGWGIRLARDRTIKKVRDLEQLVWYDSGELIGIHE